MSFFVDFCSILSLVGIWPRFVEPRLLRVTELIWDLPDQCRHLDGLKIVHLSDLHFHRKTSSRFLDKVARRVGHLKPDLIFFTGDFLCYSRLEKSEKLVTFLQKLDARHGSFCCFGNHDYSRYVSRNKEGLFDILPPPSPFNGILRGIKALFSKPRIKRGVTDSVLSIPLHAGLTDLLTKTPFKWLENATLTLPIGLNITGLGDLALGRCQQEKAFTGYNKSLPGIILSHNPDTFPALSACPGEWILSGHTHGEQIHFPWPRWARRFSQKLTRMEYPEYTRGLYKVENKQAYVNRGLGCHKPFRFCSPPEICVIKAIWKQKI